MRVSGVKLSAPAIEGMNRPRTNVHCIILALISRPRVIESHILLIPHIVLLVACPICHRFVSLSSRNCGTLLSSFALLTPASTTDPPSSNLGSSLQQSLHEYATNFLLRTCTKQCTHMKLIKLLVSEINKKFWEELINFILLIRHGPNRRNEASSTCAIVVCDFVANVMLLQRR
jgi:hypothetical protein